MSANFVCANEAVATGDPPDCRPRRKSAQFEWRLARGLSTGSCGEFGVPVLSRPAFSALKIQKTHLNQRLICALPFGASERKCRKKMRTSELVYGQPRLTRAFSASAQDSS